MFWIGNQRFSVLLIKRRVRILIPVRRAEENSTRRAVENLPPKRIFPLKQSITSGQKKVFRKIFPRVPGLCLMTFLDVWRRVRAICDYISSLYAIRPDRTVSPPGPPAHYPQSPPAPQAAPQPPTALSFPSLGFGCSFLSRFLRVKMVKLQLKMVKLRLKIVEKCHHTPDSRRVGFPPFLLSGAPGLKYGSRTGKPFI